MMRVDDSLFTRKLDGILDAAQDAAEKAVIEGTQRGAVNILGTAQRLILRSPPTGKTYTTTFITLPNGRVIPGPPRAGQGLSASHTASSPGNPPANDTGDLQRSGRVDPKPNGADVAFGMRYAVYLEFGTRRIKPRPFLGPALAEETGTTADEAAKVLRREFMS